MSDQIGRCRSEVEKTGFHGHAANALADAIDRLAADVGALKEAVCDGDEAIHERDKYKRERDTANAEVRRLISELAAAIRTIRELQADRVERQQQHAEPQPAGCPECNGDGQHDSGGTDESGKWINVPCETCRCTGTVPAAPQPATVSDAQPAAWAVRRVGGSFLEICGSEHRAESSRMEWEEAEGWVHEVVTLYTAPQPAAPPVGWLTEEERCILRNLIDITWPDIAWYGRVTTTLEAILSRAGSPPVVEVPVMRSRGDTAHADGRDAEIARLTAEVERHRMTEEEREVLEQVWPDYAANNDDAACANVEVILQRYLARTAQQEPSNG